MRWTLSSLTLVLSSSLLLAANNPNGSRPMAPPLNRAEAQNYAQQMLFIVGEVAREYVREVPRTDLLAAALSGLYEAARLPVPGTLAADAARATSEAEQLALAIRNRESLGDLEMLRGNEALLLSARAMMRSLDPHSAIISSQELNRGSGEEIVRGVGIEMEPNTGVGPLFIKTVLPGGPAQRAGVRPGDELIQVDNDPVDGMSSSQVVLKLNSVPEAIQAKHRHDITVRRKGVRQPWKVTLLSEMFRTETVLGVQRRPDHTWHYLLDGKHKIAHIRLGSLEHGTTDDLKRALRSLKADGMRGLILDLRYCPGGYLNEAVEVARLFLGEGNIAKVKYRTRGEDSEFKAAHDVNVERFLGFPMVVLVGGDTSGGAELIAAALQDNKRATVAGQRTLGKASVQTMLGLPIPNAGLKLTSGLFTRPSGKALHRFPESKPTDDWGVRPDPTATLPVSPDLARQLREWYVLQSLRPPTVRDALPLDDPENDPQRQAVLRILIDQLNRES